MKANELFLLITCNRVLHPFITTHKQLFQYFHSILIMFGGDKTREFQKGMDQQSLRRRREEERLCVRRKWREEQLQHKRRHVMQFGIAKGKTEPCRFYNMPPNGCRYGTNCRYSHDSKEQPICTYFN
eukprot:120705_1